MKQSITDTGNTRKHILRKSIESTKNIELSQVIKMIAIVMKSDRRMLRPVDIIVANTNIQIEVISSSPQTLSCNSGNRHVIYGEKFALQIAIYPHFFRRHISS